MSLLKKAVNQTAYLKAGILGFAGSGKTFTATQIAVGLSREIGDKKPVAFFDTETGSDYVIEVFERAGIELLVAKTRSFADLLTFMREAEQTCSVAIIDSITHVWQELIEAYTRKLHRTRGLQFQDWGPIKTEWRQFTDSYLNSRCHVVLCGRAGWEYDYEKNDDGKKELVKTGTKMKAENEMGYEPSLLMEMERLSKASMSGNPKAKGWIHRCYVLKDRTNRINGKEIDNPTYKSFAPVIDFLNVGGEHLAVDTTRHSDEMFDAPETSWTERAKQVAIVLEEIKDLFVAADLSGTSSDAKKQRVHILRKAFDTSSWTAIEGMSLERLRMGFGDLQKLIAATRGDAQEEEEDDAPEWGIGQPRADAVDCRANRGSRRVA